MPPSRSTLETLGRAIGIKLDQRRVVIEAVARRAETLPEGARTIVLGLDRTSAPMEEDLPPETPRRPRKRPRVRKAPPPVTVNYRMSFVGTVAFADAEGQILHTYKYAATRDDAIDAIANELRHEVTRGYLPTYRIAMEDELTFITPWCPNIPRRCFESDRPAGQTSNPMWILRMTADG